MAARARSSKAQHLRTVCEEHHSGRNKQHCHIVLELRFGPVIHVLMQEKAGLPSGFTA